MNDNFIDFDSFLEALQARVDDEQCVSMAHALQQGGEVTCSRTLDDEVLVRIAVPPNVVLPGNIESNREITLVLQQMLGYEAESLAGWRVVISPKRSQWPPNGVLRRLGGRRLGGRFLVTDETLGEGAAGTVRIAIDDQEETVVAVKLLTERSEHLQDEHRKRFVRELTLLKSLESPYVTPVIAHGEEDDGLLWYAMPVAECDLRKRLSDFAGDPSAVLEVFTQICEGVIAMHEGISPIVHRDLKPSNILLIEGHWTVSDLGIATQIDRRDTTLTGSASTLGTSYYSPPEREHSHEASERWDVFSLGIILADLWTGEEAHTRAGAPVGGPFRACIQNAGNLNLTQRPPTVRDLLSRVRRAIALTEEWESESSRFLRLKSDLDGSTNRELLYDVVTTYMEKDQDERELELILVCSLTSEQLEILSNTSPDVLLDFVTSLGQLPSRFPFQYLDDVARILDWIARRSSDENLIAQSISTCIEVAFNWNRFRAQSIASKLTKDIATDHLDIASEGLARCHLPAADWVFGGDYEWLHPGARPS
jgi:serine/threonine protein kinase